jgi:hypothetical protein
MMSAVLYCLPVRRQQGPRAPARRFSVVEGWGSSYALINQKQPVPLRVDFCPAYWALMVMV